MLDLSTAVLLNCILITYNAAANVPSYLTNHIREVDSFEFIKPHITDKNI